MRVPEAWSSGSTIAAIRWPRCMEEEVLPAGWTFRGRSKAWERQRYRRNLRGGQTGSSWWLDVKDQDHN